MMAPSSQMLTHGGILSRDWFSDKLDNRSKIKKLTIQQLDFRDLYKVILSCCKNQIILSKSLTNFKIQTSASLPV